MQNTENVLHNWCYNGMQMVINATSITLLFSLIRKDKTGLLPQWYTGKTCIDENKSTYNTVKQRKKQQPVY